jgi:hypothetical protein
MSLILGFEIFALGILGLFLKFEAPLRRKRFAFLLGLVTGLGFWLSIQWLLAALLIVLAFYRSARDRSRAQFLSEAALFAFPLLSFFIPFVVFSFWGNNGAHAHWLLAHEAAENGHGRLNSLLSNGTLLFWSGNPGNAYGPVWGGVLNPLEGALFFLGVFEWIRCRRLSLTRWIVGAASLFMVPGLLTSAYEIFRNILLFPLLLLTCALGLQVLLNRVPLQKRPFLGAAFLLFSVPLNFSHLLKSYGCSIGLSGFRSAPVAQPYGQAFDALKKIRQPPEPILLFTDLQTDVDDQSFNVATYSFNAARNPKLDPAQARYAVFLANANYKGFLSGRFPKGKWYWLGPDSFWNQGGLMLAVVPVEPGNKEVFLNWLEMDRQFHFVTVLHQFDQGGALRDKTYQQLLAMEGSSGNDPFLRSIFYEKVLFFLRDGARPSQWLFWVQKAVEKGYPASHLLVAEGLLYKSMGRSDEARAAFERAARSSVNLTNAVENLRAMGNLGKKSVR